MGWLLNLIITFICEGLIIIVTDLATYINNIFVKMYELNKSLGFDNIYKYCRELALSLVVIYALKLLLDIYVFHTNGDPDADPLEMITRLSKAVAAIMCGQWAIEIAIKFASDMAYDLVGLSASFIPESVDIATAFKAFVTAYSLSLGYLVIIIIIIVYLLKFVLLAAKRGAEIMLSGMFLPFMALDLLTTTKERWNNFMNDCIIVIFGYVVQVFCFGVFTALFRLGTDTGNIDALIACLAWLMIVIAAPKMIQKYLYRSGVGDTAKGLMRSGVSMIPYLIRK